MTWRKLIYKYIIFFHTLTRKRTRRKTNVFTDFGFNRSFFATAIYAVRVAVVLPRPRLCFRFQSYNKNLMINVYIMYYNKRITIYDIDGVHETLTRII